MSNVVTVTINGRSFRMACDEGQQDHLLSLAKIVDEKIAIFKQSYGDIGESRLAVMAAILLADEQNEAVKQVKILQRENAALKDSRAVLTSQIDGLEANIAATLETASDEVERITARLSKRE
jgi:cell division protein ZapA